jgi:hypothetical protein
MQQIIKNTDVAARLKTSADIVVADWTQDTEPHILQITEHQWVALVIVTNNFVKI